MYCGTFTTKEIYVTIKCYRLILTFFRFGLFRVSVLSVLPSFWINNYTINQQNAFLKLFWLNEVALSDAVIIMFHSCIPVVFYFCLIHNRGSKLSPDRGPCFWAGKSYEPVMGNKSVNRPQTIFRFFCLIQAVYLLFCAFPKILPYTSWGQTYSNLRTTYRAFNLKKKCL